MERSWVIGDCWLGCERTGVRVLWLGPVQWDGYSAPFMSCASCLARLMAQASAYWLSRPRIGAAS
ncbi:hypothetical protein GCM10010345_12210 [Streptomyces canarius]|uniref:Uncharacterized protein n=1 Tax=Streptomyces canarius TaxID=285453 RepID=A0ABQ3CHX9_9ACTN|nr:hypothetical protein GCM10010345_12210 [Streptomyces canarius]